MYVFRMLDDIGESKDFENHMELDPNKLGVPIPHR